MVARSCAGLRVAVVMKPTRYAQLNAQGLFTSTGASSPSLPGPEYFLLRGDVALAELLPFDVLLHKVCCTACLLGFGRGEGELDFLWMEQPQHQSGMNWMSVLGPTCIGLVDTLGPLDCI